MPDRILPIEVQLRLFTLREALAGYAQLSATRPGSVPETMAALRRVEEVRADLQPLVPKAT
jgi:hypothetical protein